MVMLEFGTDNPICGNQAPFVLGISDDADNTLRISIAISVIGTEGVGAENIEDSRVQVVLSNKRPVFPDKRHSYEIVFERYIMYQVRNESFCSRDSYEICKGKYLLIFERSRLLDQLQMITDCQFDNGSYYPGKWKHYGIYTQNHIIDVVSQYEPVVIEKGSEY